MAENVKDAAFIAFRDVESDAGDVARSAAGAKAGEKGMPWSEALFAITGILAVAYLVSRKN